MGTRLQNLACMRMTPPLLSASSLFDLLDQFGELSGLRINKSKTEGLWLGTWKCRLGKDEPFGISWPKQINFDRRLVKLKKVLNIWSSV